MASDAATETLKKTPLNAVHRASGARMVDFGGWDMPVEYSGIIAEHLAVRRAVGLFDVSHMGEIEIRGGRALDLVESATCNRVASLEDGQAQYSGLLNEKGGFIDDLLVHRVAADHYLLCVNASNQDADYDHIRSLDGSSEVEVDFASDRYVQIAVQGPLALATLQKLTRTDLAAIRYYWFARGKVSGTAAIIARTGYTGEDGFEIYVAPDEGERLWSELIEAGHEFGIVPCGLGARNTLRLESAMALHGHEISEEITPYEARLGWIVKLEKGEFHGRQALIEQKQQGVKRKLYGFKMQGRGIARDGYPAHTAAGGEGWVTSGSPAPFLEENIGMVMLPRGQAVEGQAVEGETIEIAVRSRRVEAQIVPLPFYSRPKS